MPKFKGPSLFFIATIITSLHTELSIASSTVSTTIYLRENTGVGTAVAELADILGMSIDPRTGKKFQILSQKLEVSDARMPHRNHNWLSLNESTGSIFLRRKLDREEICPKSKLCSIKLTVYVQRNSRIVTLDVEIIDMNEHAPIFPVKYILINVSEKAKIGDVISLDQYKAYDKDAGNNSLIKYSLTPNRYFSLTQFVDERRSQQHLQIEIRRSLDYERESLHRLQLTATDKADQPLSSHVSLQIRIVDENDNNPVFEQAEYSVMIPEDTEPGEQLIRVQAHDIDTGLAGTVRYYLSSINKKTTFDLLNVNELTGDVSLASRLDWESLTRLVAFIEARDLGKEQRIGSTQLIIDVVDVNDNKPIINVNFISSSFKDDTVYISELANKSYPFAYVSAKDKDFELSGETVLSIRTSLPETDKQDGLIQNVANTFALNANGVLIVNQNLDITKHDRYDIVITACDKGLEKLCSHSTIHVVILDENNNSPKFDQPTENITISENTAVGSTIMTVRATDDDAIVPSALKKNEEERIVTSTNGVITYSLLNGDGTFAIGPKTGVITLVRPLDREHVSEWKVVVEASDGGKPKSLKGRCVIDILISDVNDNAPMFVNPVNEGATFHSTILKDAVITRVQAVDYDKGENAKLKYKILYEDGVRQTMHVNSSLFVLDSTNGDMRLNKSNSMLPQSLGSHDLVIMVSDAGVPPMTSKRQIQVVITDDLFIPSSSSSSPGKGPQFPTTLVIIIGALSAGLLLLILVVVIVVIKCKKENKKVRTYACKKHQLSCPDNALSDVNGKSIVSKKIIRRESSSSKATTSLQTSLMNYESNTDVTNLSRSDAMISHQFQTPASTTSRSGSQLKKKTESISSAPSIVSHRDGDSGHGDSDPDIRNSELNLVKGNPRQRYASEMSSSEELIALSNFGNKCSEQCVQYGHSDACWMPEESVRLKRPSRLTPEPLPYFYASSPFCDIASQPSQSDQSEQAGNLAPIPETVPLQAYWSNAYSRSNLSSIYSNVLPATYTAPPTLDESGLRTTSLTYDLPKTYSERNHSSADSTTTGYVTESEVI
ncbi:unnamed protein product [Clavelina lepadiformis]|uniref:Cadherin domain-containing protein n=1 Tax=Clavelina lepadiformis TaxID=159417 RepID=A0ABP0GLD3_CLALP